jgi:hypothetical protein
MSLTTRTGRTAPALEEQGRKQGVSAKKLKRQRETQAKQRKFFFLARK